MTFIHQFTCLISISGLKTGKQWSSWSWFQTKSTSSEVEGNYLKLEGDYSKSKECASYHAWTNLKSTRWLNNLDETFQGTIDVEFCKVNDWSWICANTNSWPVTLMVVETSFQHRQSPTVALFAFIIWNKIYQPVVIKVINSQLIDLTIHVWQQWGPN